jgi:hypothetical protein
VGIAQTELPFYEGPHDALKAAVTALGGTKQVGPILWPDLAADAAGRRLLDCLNDNRPEKLDLSQVMLILRLAKEAGCVAPFQWVAMECGFDARPIARADEVDRLTTVIEQTSKTLSVALLKLEGLRK